MPISDPGSPQSLYDQDSSDAEVTLQNSGTVEKGVPTSDNTNRGFTPQSDYVVDNGQSQTGVNIQNSGSSDFTYDPSYGFGSENSTSKYAEYSRNVLGEVFSDTGGSFFKYGLYSRLATEMPLSDESRAGAQPLNGEIYDHEDPTIYGFDIEIDVLNSPLFNGEIQNFFTHPTISLNSEVKNRLQVLTDFQSQFFRFFIPNSTAGLNISEDANQRYRLNHYIKKIAGLNNLVINSGSEKNKIFADYKKDVIKIAFTEDVSANIGYMSALYKILTWSKYNGKMIIPENLLRFDCKITISEVRHFNRVARALSNPGQLEVLKDNLSRYVYSLSECQLFFEKMTHDDDVDMSTSPGGKAVELYEISMSYKFSTMKMEKFINYLQNNQLTTSSITINENSAHVNKATTTQQVGDTSVLVHDPYYVSPMDTTNVDISNGTIEPLPPDVGKVTIRKFGPAGSTDTASPNVKTVSNTNSLDSSISNDATSGANGGLPTKQSALDKFKQNTKTRLNQLKKNVVRAAVREANQQILIRAQLLNSALLKIQNAAGLRRMSNPRNVYFGDQDVLDNGVKNAVNSFVGQSLNEIFSNVNGVTSTAFYNKTR